MILNIFFSIKLIRQFRGAKKFSGGNKLPKALQKNIIFQNSGGSCTFLYDLENWTFF
jgi:hypothetical protein